MSAAKHPRTTERKRIIQQIFSEKEGRPHVIEELRWEVLRREAKDKRGLAMTRSYCVSFARTIRDHLPGWHTYKAHGLLKLHRGLIARAAVYRITQESLLNKFLSGESPTVYFTDSLWFKRKTVACWMYPSFGGDTLLGAGKPIEKLILPITSPICVVSQHPPTDIELQDLAKVPWSLYLMTRNGPYHRAEACASINIHSQIADKKN